MQPVLQQDHDALAQQLQQAIRRIQGVNDASVVLDENGAISEIHLVSSVARRPKQIVRDTESLLSARFGLRVDYRKISLVQLDPEGRPGGWRLRFISAAPHPQNSRAVQVVLQTEDGRHEGVASFSSSSDTENEAGIRAAADATLYAVQEATDHIVPLSVEETRLIAVDGPSICLAVVRAETSHGEEKLTGTCLVQQSLFEAASKATLDAINRRLPVWIARATGDGSRGRPAR